jgi:hypothetical protein
VIDAFAPSTQRYSVWLQLDALGERAVCPVTATQITAI